MKLEIELSEFEAQCLARMAEDSGTTAEAKAHIIIRVHVAGWMALKSGIDLQTWLDTSRDLWSKHYKGEQES